MWVNNHIILFFTIPLNLFILIMKDLNININIKHSQKNVIFFSFCFQGILMCSVYLICIYILINYFKEHNLLWLTRKKLLIEELGERTHGKVQYTMFSGKTSCGSTLARLQLRQLKPLCFHLETQECFQVSSHSHTGCILWSFEAPEYSVSQKQPMASEEHRLVFQSKRPWKTTGKPTLFHFILFYFILLQFLSFFLYGFSTFGQKLLVFSLWL